MLAMTVDLREAGAVEATGPRRASARARDPALPARGSNREVRVTVPSGRVVALFATCIAVLSLAHVVVMSAHYLYFTFDRFRYFATVVNLNQEANPATWFSSFLLLVSAALLSVIAVDARANRRPAPREWAILALAFLYISIDETGVLHERTIVPMRQAFNLSGPFFYGWVVLAIPLLCAFGLWYLRFFLRLPPRFRLRLLTAGLLYLSGALGVEMIEGLYDEAQGGGGESDLTFALLVAVEETCEMVGVLVLIRALFGYIHEHVGEIRVRLAP